MSKKPSKPGRPSLADWAKTQQGPRPGRGSCFFCRAGLREEIQEALEAMATTPGCSASAAGLHQAIREAYGDIPGYAQFTSHLRNHEQKAWEEAKQA
jgi:hypothetical protein